MPLFHKDDKKVLFVHIPKTAGTSIEYAFMDAGWKDKHLIIRARGDGGFDGPCHPQHWHHGLMQRYVYPEEGQTLEEFALVRNPFTRCISEYFWIGGGQPQDYNNNFFNGLTNYIQDNLKKYVKNEEQWQADKEGWLQKKKRYHADNHWRPQWHFIGPNTKVYKYEELGEKVFPKLKEKYGLGDLPNKYTNVSLDLKRPTKYPDDFELTDEFKKLYLKVYSKDHWSYGYDIPFKQN